MSLELFINSGSIPEIDLSKIEGIRFEDVFSVASTTCATLKYNTGTFIYPTVTSPVVLSIPQTNYFMFDEDCSSDWDGTTPTAIRLNLKALGRLPETTNYQQKLFEIIRDRLVDSEITIKKLSTISELDPPSYKTFHISEASYLERVYDNTGEKFYAMEWGSTVLTETADFLGLFNYLPASSDAKDGFFTLVVTQTDTSAPELPAEDDELLICITPSKKYGFFEGVSGSFDSINITNVDITSASMESLFVSNDATITGSMNLTGSLLVNNQSVVVSKTKYGKLAFSKYINGEQSYYEGMEVNPPYASFKFPTNPRDWTQPVNRITMDIWNAVFITGDPGYGGTRYGYCPDDTIDMWYNYINKMTEIINKGLTDSIMTLTSVDFPNTFKQFKITGGTYYLIYNVNGDCARINWGDNFTNWTNISWDNLPPNNKILNPTMFSNSQYQQENAIMWPDYYNYNNGDLITPTAYFDMDLRFDELPSLDPISTSAYTWYEYIEFDVEQIETSRGLTSAPSHDDEFSFNIETGNPEKRKEVVVIESSTEWEMPYWADKVTAYVVGAGGGGGGGTAGYKHYSGLPIVCTDSLKAPNGELLKSFGHELMSGGGGGAGGNVAVNTFNRSTIPAGSKLSILIGTGGVGGDGYGFANANNTAEDTIRFSISIERPKEEPDVKANPNEFHVFSNFLKIPKLYEFFLEPASSKWLGLSYFYRLNKYQDKNDGKRGGPSTIILKSTPTNPNVMQTLIQADGGTGGRSGIGIRSIYPSLFLLYTLAYNDNGTPLRGGAKVNQYYKITQYWVPGGGSSIGNSFGYDKIYLGSPGGYGITMGTVMHDYDLNKALRSEPTRQGYSLIVNKNLKRNTAPPQKWENNSPTFDLPDLKLPYGDTGVNRTDGETSQKPSYPSPTGGGGGAGKCMSAMEYRLLSEEGPINSNYLSQNDPQTFSPLISSLEYLNGKTELGYTGDKYNIGFPNNLFPDDYYRDLAIKMNQATTLGRGGTFISTNVLVDEVDSNGVNWIVKLGKGGDGGYDVSENPHAAVAGYTSNILPQNGSGDSVNGFGGGGGGGASKYTKNIHYDGGDISIVGQNGADGGKGVVVLVIES